MQRVTGENLGAVLREHVEPTAVQMTDGAPAYVTIGREFDHHESVDRVAGEYARGEVHINTAEGFFSQRKCGIDGTHHHVNAQHLDRYVADFDYRYNSRAIKDGERTVQAIRQAAGKRMRYCQQQESGEG